MENVSEDIAYLDTEIELVTSTILSSWDWRSPDKSFGTDADSPLCASSDTSFDSTCSSPEMPPSSSDRRSLDFPYPQRNSGGYQEKPSKPKMSIKRRMKASEREKMRMRSLADALHQLRDYLPPDYSQRGQPLTKIQTLKYTIQYINELSDLLKAS
ncbi:mesogenin-1 [Paramormyrops kingsleyae]|uniref:mesogenin-1 n=1 Tax=Paramormyrops kingsleyae TaxID=1676925 RepID=UPI000CD5FF2F|nr:mesogenin-1 [Paramormyrops kingsleyae]